MLLMPSILMPNIPQDTERKHRTQDTNTAHNRRLVYPFDKTKKNSFFSTKTKMKQNKHFVKIYVQTLFNFEFFPNNFIKMPVCVNELNSFHKNQNIIGSLGSLV